MISLAAGLLLFAAGARAQTGPAAGSFDTYAFVVEWLPQFCAKVPGSPECAGLGSGSFAAKNLVLHGMWPNQSGDSAHSYGYCGDALKEKGLDNNKTWCRLTLPALTAPTRTALDKYMPGTASCLEHHEWTRHGSCSGLSADDYFAAEAAFAAAVDASVFGQYLGARAGGTAELDAALAQFDAAFGAGASASVTFHCATSGGASSLNEIHIALSPGAQASSALASVLTTPDSSDRTDCPSSFRLLPAGR